MTYPLGYVHVVFIFSAQYVLVQLLRILVQDALGQFTVDLGTV